MIDVEMAAQKLELTDCPRWIVHEACQARVGI